MDRKIIKGMLMGAGVMLIVSATVFYSLVLHLRSDQVKDTMTEEQIVQEARDLGMIYITEINDLDALTEDYIKKMARAMGMVEAEKD